MLILKIKWRKLPQQPQKRFGSQPTLLQNLHLNLVSQGSKTEMFQEGLKGSFPKNYIADFTAQLFNASFILHTDICINFMENLRTFTSFEFLR